MTVRERQLALLDDLLAERAMYPNFRDLYNRKIAELRSAMGEADGSGTGLKQGRDTSVQDVPGGDAQTL